MAKSVQPSRGVISSLGLLLLLLMGFIAVFRVHGVSAKNNNPTFDRGDDITVTEDSEQYGKTAWATNIKDNDGNKQSLSFVLSAANTKLFKTQPAISDTGTLTFFPDEDQYGATIVSVYLKDSGHDGDNRDWDCTPGDCSKSKTYQFTVTITAVNDCPKFSINGDVSVDEDVGSITKTGWATGVKRGPQSLSNEDKQTLTWSLTNDNTALFKQQPSIVWSLGSPTTADLHFETNVNAFGTAKLTIKTKDNGGTSDGGCDESSTQTFSINVNSVNDPPSFTMGTTPIEVDEDSGSFTQNGWASSVSVGAAGESTQQVAFTLQATNSSATELFETQPAIDSSGTLTFEVKSDRNTEVTSAYFYVQLSDDDPTTPKSSCSPITSCPKLQIIIHPINDLPYFTIGSDATVHEDLLELASPPSPAAYSLANWATGISPGNDVEKDIENQQVVFEVNAENTGLFTVQPAVDSAGTLTFTLSPHKNGVSKVYVRIRDTATSPGYGPMQHFQVTVLSVNDAPTFDITTSQPYSLAQDPGAQQLDNFISNAQPGPSAASDESTQKLTWSTSAQPSSLFSVMPTVIFTSASTAKLTFVVADGEIGEGVINVTLKDDGGTERSGVDHQSASFRIAVASTNTAPSFVLAGTELRIDEDSYSSGYNYANWVKDILPGTAGAIGTREALTQTVSFTVTADNNGLFSAQPTISSAGTLSFTPATNAYGSSVVSVVAQDNANPSMSSATQQFTLHILAVNDAPYFSVGKNIAIAECRSTESQDCSYHYAGWATDISTSGVGGGLTNEASQSLTFTTEATAGPKSTTFSSLFSSPITIDSVTGTMSFSLKRGGGNTGGLTTIAVTLMDNGGTSGGGTDRYTLTFSFTVTEYVPPPSFSFGSTTATNVVLYEDSGLSSIVSFIVAIDPGKSPSSTGASATTVLSFAVTSSNTNLFTATPSIVFASETEAMLRVEPKADAFGTADLTVTLANSETGLSSMQYRTVEVRAVNDAPSFSLLRTDIVLSQGASSQAINLVTNINPGPGGESNTQTVSFSVSCSGANTTAPGGALTLSEYFSVIPSVEPQGTLFFRPQPSAVGSMYCSVVMKDNGGAPAVNDRDTSVGLQYFSIRIEPINHAPSFLRGSDVTVYEDAGLQKITQWATSISTGDAPSETGQVQALTFSVICTVVEGAYGSSSSFFALEPTVNPEGELTFSAKPNANGAARCSIQLRDDGNSTTPHVNQSPTQSFLIAVIAVNDAPRFTVADGGLTLVRYQGDTQTDVASWASALSAGPLDEQSTQQLSFTVQELSSSTTGGSVFGSTPAVSPTSGTLTLPVRQEAYGTAALKVCLRDNGGTVTSGTSTTTGGSSSSAIPVSIDETCVTVSLSVVQIATGPTVGTSTANVQVLEDEGTGNSDGYLVLPEFVTRLGAGTTGTASTTAQITAVQMSCSCPSVYDNLFAKDPLAELRSTTATGGSATTMVGDLKIALKPNSNGVCSRCTLAVFTNAGLNSTADFTVTVLAVNDPPSFELATLAASPSSGSSSNTATSALGGQFDSRVDVFSAAADTNGTPVVIPGWAKKVSAGPNEESSTQSVSFSLQFIPRVGTPAGSGVLSTYFAQIPTLSSNGTLSFSLRPGVDARVLSPYRFKVTLSDSGGTQYGGYNTAKGVLVSGLITEVYLALYVSAPATAPPPTPSGNSTDTNSSVSFAIGQDVIVLEDSGFYSRSGWAIVEGAETVAASHIGGTFVLTPEDPILFAQPPALLYPSGDIFFQPAPNRYGSARVSVSLRLTSTNNTVPTTTTVSAADDSFVVTVIPVNDRPTFSLPQPTWNLLEDSVLSVGHPPTTIFTEISAGPFETNQTLQWFFEQISSSSSSATQSSGSTITATPLASPTVVSRLTVNSTHGSVEGLVLRPDGNGAVSLMVIARDDGGTTNGGIDISASAVLKIDVEPVNDAPTFALASRSVHLEHSWTPNSAMDVTFRSDGTLASTQLSNNTASSTSSGGTVVFLKHFVRDILPGPPTALDEIEEQKFIRRTVQCTGDHLFVAPPTLGSFVRSSTVGVAVANTNNSASSSSYVADVRLEVDVSASGTVSCNVTLADDGGTENGGQPTTGKSFDLQLNRQNQPPRFKVLYQSLEVAPETVAKYEGFMYDLTPGPSVEQFSQSVAKVHVLVGDISLFSAIPKILLDANHTSKGSLEFTAGTSFGTTNISIVAVDDQGKASVPAVVYITVAKPLSSQPSGTLPTSALTEEGNWKLRWVLSRTTSSSTGISSTSAFADFTRAAFQGGVANAVAATPTLQAFVPSGPIQPYEVVLLAMWQPTSVEGFRRRQQQQQPGVYNAVGGTTGINSMLAIEFYLLGSSLERNKELFALAQALSELSNVHDPFFIKVEESLPQGYAVVSTRGQYQSPTGQLGDGSGNGLTLNKTLLIIIIVLGAVLLILLVAVCIAVCSRRSRSSKNQKKDIVEVEEGEDGTPMRRGTTRHRDMNTGKMSVIPPSRRPTPCTDPYGQEDTDRKVDKYLGRYYTEDSYHDGDEYVDYQDGGVNQTLPYGQDWSYLSAEDSAARGKKGRSAVSRRRNPIDSDFGYPLPGRRRRANRAAYRPSWYEVNEVQPPSPSATASRYQHYYQEGDTEEGEYDSYPYDRSDAGSLMISDPYTPTPKGSRSARSRGLRTPPTHDMSRYPERGSGTGRQHVRMADATPRRVNDDDKEQQTPTTVRRETPTNNHNRGGDDAARRRLHLRRRDPPTDLEPLAPSSGADEDHRRHGGPMRQPTQYILSSPRPASPPQEIERDD